MASVPETEPRTATSPDDTRRVLVTGGSGFIGSHLVEHLLELGRSVVVVDDLSTGRAANLDRARAVADATEGVTLEIVTDTVERALPSLDASSFTSIHHLAAAVGVRLVLDDPVRTIETNVHDTASILRFASSADVPILIASTSEVYGKGVRSPFHEDDDVVYGPTTRSRWSYACSKAIDEYLALAHHDSSGLRCVIVRFFNTVGPRQVGTYGMVLPRFVERALRGEPIEVHGDGGQSRCFCDGRDSVRALPRLLETSACHGRVFNLGRDEPITIGALAETVRTVLGSESEIRLVPYHDVFRAGFEDLRERVPDLARVREAIGFAPSIPLEQTIRDLADEIGGAATASAPATGSEDAS